jgi:hypothetical protein
MRFEVEKFDSAPAAIEEYEKRAFTSNNKQVCPVIKE